MIMTRTKRNPIKKTAAYLKLRLRLAELEGINDAEKNDITKTAEYLNLKPALGESVIKKAGIQNAMSVMQLAPAASQGLGKSITGLVSRGLGAMAAHPYYTTGAAIGLGGLGSAISAAKGWTENKDKPGMNWLGAGLGATGLAAAEGFSGKYGLLNNLGTKFKLTNNAPKVLQGALNATKGLSKNHVGALNKLFDNAAMTSPENYSKFMKSIWELRNTPRNVNKGALKDVIKGLTKGIKDVDVRNVGSSLGRVVRDFNVPTGWTRLGRLGAMAAGGVALGGYVAPSVVDWWRGKGLIQNPNK
jgi:hypothetical protein